MNIKVNFLIFICSAFCINLVWSKNTVVSQNGQLQVIGTQLSNKNGDPVVLRGVSFGWSNEWGIYYNKQVVKKLAADWKATVLRASMGVGAENDYLKNPVYAEKCVTNVVNQAIKEGVYVIIDFHTHSIFGPEAKAFFSKMATKYGKYPNVIYEIFNEPVKQSWGEVKSYSEEIIKTIRAIDPDNIILVGTPHWDQDIHLAAADPILNQKNIMYTVHFYAATHNQWLRDRTDAAIAKGIPVFVSECAGMEASGDGFLDEAEWKLWVEWMESRKLSWACWSMSAKVETCSMLIPKTPANAKLWKETDIKPWGKLVREDLIRLH